MSGKPNVILIMTDQQRWDFLFSAKGGSSPISNIDNLTVEGVTFDHCNSAAASVIAESL
tara:strand:+ start:678 stop:854 length:177 start_codon:yes stop_codon:yes gene_type:complete